MFVQVIQGRTSDSRGLEEQMRRWQADLMPGARGFLGSTAGTDDSGNFIACARFESEEMARANSDRPEQGRWWAETEKYFDGEVRFYDCTEVDEVLGGGSDDAGFVQIIQGTARDKEAVKGLDSESEGTIREERPDVLGGYTVWQGNDFTSVNYFTSEEEAREGEAKSQTQEFADKFSQLVDNVKWIDIKKPILVSP
jgi:hypothetical protein